MLFVEATEGGLERVALPLGDWLDAVAVVDSFDVQPLPSEVTPHAPFCVARYRQSHLGRAAWEN